MAVRPIHHRSRFPDGRPGVIERAGKFVPVLEGNPTAKERWFRARNVARNRFLCLPALFVLYVE
jgi:hypothetical protein